MPEEKRQRSPYDVAVSRLNRRERFTAGDILDAMEHTREISPGHKSDFKDMNGDQRADFLLTSYKRFVVGNGLKPDAAAGRTYETFSQATHMLFAFHEGTPFAERAEPHLRLWTDALKRFKKSHGR